MALAFTGVALLHFVVSLGFLAASFGMSMRALDSGDSSGFVGDLIGFASSVLLFPASGITGLMPPSVAGGLMEWPLYVANSLLWSAVICWSTLKLYLYFGNGFAGRGSQCK